MNVFRDFFDLHIMIMALPQLLRGMLVTLEIAMLSIALGVTLGLVLAILRVTILRPKTPFLVRMLNIPLAFYIDSLRSIPPLVLLIVIYFALPYLGVFFPRFESAVFTFVVIISAFSEEIFRGGIESINPGQLEAARGLGLSYWQAIKNVLIPQAFRIVIPTLTSRVISITKDVSLASVIGVADLLKQARTAQGLYSNPSPLLAATLLFIVLFLPLVLFSSHMERKLK